MAAHGERLRIPRRHLKPLTKVLGLTVDQAAALVEALRKSAPSVQFDALASTLASVARLDARDALDIVEMLASLYQVRMKLRLGIDELSAGIRRSAADSDSQDLREAVGRAEAQDRLREVLSATETFGIAARARDLMSAYEHRLCEARIVTDVRPIFKDKPEEGPAAVIFTHTLQITYHDDGDLKELHLAILPNDLADLEETIQRARGKESSLRAVLKVTGLPQLEVDLH